MTFLTRLFESIRCQRSAISYQLSAISYQRSAPEPNFAAINNRALWPVSTTRGRWVDYRNDWK